MGQERKQNQQAFTEPGTQETTLERSLKKKCTTRSLSHYIKKDDNPLKVPDCSLPFPPWAGVTSGGAGKTLELPGEKQLVAAEAEAGPEAAPLSLKT